MRTSAKPAPARAIGRVGALSLMTVRTTVGAGVEGSATSWLRGPLLSSEGLAAATPGSATRAITSTASTALERCVIRVRAGMAGASSRLRDEADGGTLRPPRGPPPRTSPPRSAQSATKGGGAEPRLLRAPLQRLGIEDGDVATPGLDDAKRAQQLQRLADRLTRRSGPRGELLLRERQLDLDPPGCGRPEALGQLDEAMRDPPDDVMRREVGLLRVGVTQAPSHHPQDHQRDTRTALEKRREGGARDQEGVDGLEGGHRRRARLAVDRRQLPEQVAGAADGDDHLAAVRAE